MRGDGGRWVSARAVSVTVGVVVLMLGAVAHASTGGGIKLWVARYTGSASGSGANSIARSPDGSTLFVTGESASVKNGSDYATVAYVTSTGAQQWVARYNGPGNGDDIAVSVAASPDASTVFVTGASTGMAGDMDYATVAYVASTGAKLWVKRYKGPGNGGDMANSVTTSPDGSKMFVTGQSAGTTGAQDYVTVAYDPSTGAQLWLKRYKGPVSGGSGALSVAASPDGSTVFVTGESSGNGSGQDYATVAYDASTGAQRWVARHNGPGNGDDRAISVAVSHDGSNVFVTGGVTGTNGNMDYETVAYDASTGAQRWVQSYPGPGVPFNPFGPTFGSVAASPDGSKVFLTCPSLGTTTGVDYATVAYDASTGVPLWDSRYNGPGNSDDYPTRVATSPDGSKVFVTGTSNGTSSGGDYATVAYDASTGAQLWVGRYNGPGNDWDAAGSLVTSPDGSKVFVTGSSTGKSGGGDYATVAYTA